MLRLPEGMREALTTNVAQAAALRDALAFLLSPVSGDDARDQLSPELVDSMMSVVEGTLSYIDPQLRGTDNLPETGGALLVGNHGLMGIDSFALYPLIWRAVRRLPRGLGDRVLFEIEPLRRFVTHAGGVPGSRDTAVDLLTRDELVLVYPGGSVDSFKGPADHYKLPWGERTGFIRVAMRAQRPIIPVMAAGIDDAYRFLFHDRHVFPRLFGQGKARYAFPVSLGMGLLPLPGSQFTFHLGAPIAPPVGPELADDEGAVQAFHQEVWQACQAQLDAAVAEWRAGRGDATVAAR
ncbi:MAG: acyltransferase family protein [Myxococcales bacterium]|nr:acyltransferase family protein [Myxococcales bacterium]